MQPATWLEHARDLGKHPPEFRHCLRHVPAHHQVKTGIRVLQSEGIALLVLDPPVVDPTVAACQCQVAFEDVDSDQGCLRKPLRQPARDLTGAAAKVKDPQPAGQAVALEQSLFLRPDRFGLMREIASHGLVAHLFGLRIAVVHGGTPARIGRRGVQYLPM